MTKRLLVATLLLSIVAVPMYGDFNKIARAIDGHAGIKRIWIPFLGLGRFFVRAIHPEGVHDFQLAVFEGSRNLDTRSLHAMFESKLDPNFQPLVQVRSKKSRESSFIYVRPRGDDQLELMVLVHDADDTVLVRVVVNPERIVRELGEPRNVSRAAMRH